MRADPQQVQFLRSLKGAPSSIIIALVMFNCSLQNKDLEMVTGYSDKPIANALALLENYGIVQNNGLTNGWSLASGIHQLELFPHSLLESSTALLGARQTLEGGAASLGTRTESDFAEGSAALLGARTQLIINELGDNTSPSVGNSPTPSSPPVGNSPTPNPQNSQSVGNSPTPNPSSVGNSPTPLTRAPERPLLTTTTTSQDKSSSSSSSSKHEYLDSEIFRLAQQQPNVFDLLLEAGVGASSNKMLNLLQMHMDWEDVEAHVHQFQYELSQGHNHSVGLLIKRFEDGDPPPPLRCKNHLHLEPCMLCDLNQHMTENYHRGGD